MREKVLLTGDEAVARGAWEAGCTVAAAYPGTPSTEILEAVGALYKEDIYAQWAANEKVALEIAGGASIGGARALAAMKHVGLNVAADPLFTLAYTGVNGGLVVVSADDPGCYSSQNEQDNRQYAPLARIAMLEPSDSQEALDFTKAAFALSERFDMPVLLRVTTRVCHSKSLVELGEREETVVRPYVRNPAKYSMLPVPAMARHALLENNLLALEAYGADCALNRTEMGRSSEIGVITSGMAYQHAREVFGDEVCYLKLGLTHPLPSALILEFAAKVERLVVIEEGEPYLETRVRALGLNPVGKEKVTRLGELSPSVLRAAFKEAAPQPAYQTPLAPAGRPPVLCAGCPHRGFYFAMQKRAKQFVAVGDIGCYSLGVNPPHNGFDISICMGSGFSAPIGLSKALERQGDTRKVFGLLGDSTFFHSGMNSLLDIIHSGANVCACVLDNSITAMTGHQQNPGTQYTLMGTPAPAADIVGIARAFGLPDERICVVDPVDQQAMGAAIDSALSVSGPFLIVARRPCVLIKEVLRQNAGRHVAVDPDKCVGCKSCLKIGCPSLAIAGKKVFVADETSCNACGLCVQQCKFGALAEVLS